MAKFMFASILLFVVFSAFNCDAQKQRFHVDRLQRNRQLSRQETEEPVTPYPSADELKPEIPFDETVSTSADEPIAVGEENPIDEVTQGAANEPIPDEVYGPPEVAVLYNTPDEVYGPPEVEANLLATDVTLARQRQAHLIKARRQASYRHVRLAQLRGAKPKHSV